MCGLVAECFEGEGDILKNDIERSEYSVTESLLDNSIYPAGTLVELHHFFSSVKFDRSKQLINSLLNHCFELFSVKSYNYSFIRTKDGESL